MTARGRYVFDVDTASANANVSRLNKNAEGVGNAFLKATGPLGRILSATGAATAGGAILLKTWTEIVGKMDEAANRLQTGAQSRARVLSLAGTAGERDRLSNAIASTQAETGVDETRASNFQFQLESLGLGGNRQELARVFNLGQDAEAVAVAVSRLRKVFGEEAGSVTELVNKLFAGAASSEAGIDQFGETIAKIGSIVQSTGTPLDDLIATVSQLGGKEMSELATNIKALATSATRQGATGGLIKFVEDLSAKGLNNKQLAAELGSVEAFEAFRLIQGQLGSIPGARANLASAVSGDIVTQRLGIVGGDPRVAAAQALAQQQAGTRLSEDEAYAITEAARLRRNAAFDQSLAESGHMSAFMSAPLTYLGYQSGFRRVMELSKSPEYFDRQAAEALENIRENTAKPPPRYRPENQAHPDLPQGGTP